MKRLNALERVNAPEILLALLEGPRPNYPAAIMRQIGRPPDGNRAFDTFRVLKEQGYVRSVNGHIKSRDYLDLTPLGVETARALKEGQRCGSAKAASMP